MSGRIHRMPFGAEFGAEGVRFRLWAPDAGEVILLLQGPELHDEILMPDVGNGWREVRAAVPAGCRYRFRIDGGLAVPDPASRFQPDDVHGASEVVDPLAYSWRSAGWRGRPWEEAVIYELHVGTFTAGGTFRAAREKLGYLAGLGVTAIELMPLADFPGGWDWGYDGVDLFAPDASYGRPEDLKDFVDEAHQHGLTVFLDVVYNHFGPEGNYLNAYARRFFDAEKHTAWGAAINFEAEGAEVVRRFFIENALYWLEEFAMDGLRLDAVHAIDDNSPRHVLEELAAAVTERIPADRRVHLILENDRNEARFLARDERGRPRHYVAQWNDDIHHALHVLLTGEARGYYADYADQPFHHLDRCLTEGFAYQNDPSPFRAGELRGEPSAHLPPTAFISFLQNHDQIGNRAYGERLAAIAPPEAVRAGLALLLLAPSPPLLFMGEEWGAREPFLFFCDFGEDLRDAVRDGRRKEFSSFPEFANPKAQASIPDPVAQETFRRSKLDWAATDASPYREMRQLTTDLLGLRAREIAPRLAGITGGAGKVLALEPAAITWTLGDGSRLSLLANLRASAAPAPTVTFASRSRLLFATPGAHNDGSVEILPAWSVVWLLDEKPEEGVE